MASAVGFLFFVIADQPLLPRKENVRWMLSPSCAGHFTLKKFGNIQEEILEVPFSALKELDLIPYLYKANSGPNRAPIQRILDQFKQERGATPIAAINAGFFDMATGLPIGFLIQEGEIEFFNMPQNIRRSMIGWRQGDSENPIVITSPKHMPKVWIETPSQRFGVHHVNIPGGKHALSIFNPRFGRFIVPYPEAIYLIVESNRIIQRIDTPRLPVLIPDHGYVIALHGDSKQIVSQLTLGTSCRLYCELSPKLRKASIVDGLLAGPRLLEGGSIQVTAVQEGLEKLKSPDRVALGITKDQTLLLAWFHHNDPKGLVSFEDVATLLQKQGAVEAIGLDGGRSRSLWANIQDPAYQGVICETGRPISNILVLSRRP